MKTYYKHQASQRGDSSVRGGSPAKKIIALISYLVLLPFRLLRKILSLTSYLIPHKLMRRLSSTQRLFVNMVVVATLLIFGVWIYTSFINPEQSQAAWFNDSWSYRQAITVKENANTNVSSYPVKLTLSNLGSKAQSNCADLRVVNGRGKVVPSQIETCNTSGDTILWYQADLNANEYQQFYVYYGNASATALSFPTTDNQLSATASATTHQFTLQNNKTELMGDTDNASGAIRNLIDVPTGRDSAQTTGSSHRVDYHYEANQGDAAGDRGSEQVLVNGPIFKTIYWTESAGSYFTVYRKATLFANYPILYQDWSLKNTSGASHTYNSSHHSQTESQRCYDFLSNNLCDAASGDTQGGVSNTYSWFIDSSVTVGMCKIRSASSTVGGNWRPGGNPNPALTLNDQQTSDWYEYYMRPITQSSDCTTYADIQYSNAPTITYASEEQSPGPVAYWKFDEGTGTTTKDSAGIHNASLQNGTSWASKDMCVSGKCLKFDGVDDDVSMGTGADYFPMNTFTICAWIKTPGLASGMTENGIMSMTYGLTMWLNSSGRLYVRLDDGVNGPQLNTTDNLADNTWHYVCTSYDGTKQYLYTDGIQKASANRTWLGTTRWPTNSVTFGQDNNNAAIYKFNGFIDEPKIYNYARSTAQIQADYNSRGSVKGTSTSIGSGTSSTLTNGLIGYWKMDETSWNGTTGEILDSSGNGNTQTATGATITSASRFGNGGSFDGATAYTASTTNITCSLNQSVSTWFNGTTTGGNRTIFELSSCGGRFLVYFANNGTIIFYPHSGSSINTTSTYADSAWHHLTVTTQQINSTQVTARIYVDGTLAKESNVTFTSPGAANKFYMGSVFTHNANFFSGTLDEMRLYNRALSASEVSQLYNYAPGPVAYWDFEDKNATTVKDKSGNGYDGTPVHNPQWTSGKYGSALSVNDDTRDDYVQVSNFPTITNNYTIEGWINFPYFSTLGGDSNKAALLNATTCGASYSIEFIIQNTNKIGLGRCGQLNTLPSTGTITLGKWTHIAATVDSSNNITYYINGVQAGTATTATSLAILGNLALGGNAIRHTIGAIDEVKIYNYARTSGQIVSDMNASHPLGGSPVGSQVGYWKFDEGYGTVAHDSGPNNINGTITGPTWTNDGKFGKALNFNINYINLGNPSALQFTTGFTISAWINSNTASAQQGIFSKWYNAASPNRGGYRFLLTSQNGLTLVLSNDGTNQTTVSTPNNVINTGTWYHVVAVYDGSSTTAKIYINGALQASSTSAPSSIFNTTQNANIGSSDAGTTSNSFRGLIDEVKVYSAPLTASDIQIDYNHGSSLAMGSLGVASDGSSSSSASTAYCIPGDTSTCSAPVGEWNFEEGTGTTANDSSGNGNTGTLTSGPTWTQGKIGKALNFDGSNDYVNITSLHPAGSAVSVGAWIKPGNTIGTNGRIVSTYTGTYSFILAYDSTATVMRFLTTTSNGSVTATGATSITDPNTWYYVEGVYDGSKVYIYVNGALDGSAAQTGSLSNTANNIRLGSDGGGSAYKGKIDNVRIYDYARTPAQVAYDYNRGAPVAQYKFDECQGTTIHSSTLPYDPSLNGTLTIGGSGTQTSAGTCTTASTAWGNGASGKFNSSLYFDGTDDYATANVPVSASDATISLWVKNVAVGAGAYIFRADANIRTYIQISGSTILFIKGNPSVTVATTPAPAAGAWKHIVLEWYTIGGTQYARAFADGKALGNPVTFSDSTAGTYATVAGFAKTGTQNASGQMDDLQIYNYALTASQVQNLYNQNSSVRYGP